jgi:hypothetical protein
MKNLKNRIMMTKAINAALLTAISVAFLLPVLSFAQNNGEYQVLAPLPGVGENAGGTTTLQDYVPAMFNLLIGLAAVAAVLMIVIGGFQYISSDAIQGKSAGKDRIKNSILGLILVISAWLILYTVNPNLLRINLNIEQVTAGGPKVTLGGTLSAGTGQKLPGYAMDDGQIAFDKAIRDQLYSDSGGKITVNAGPCTTGQTSGCTNLNDLPVTTVTGLEDLQKECGCSLTISGGTEGGHASHGPNLPPVDLRFNSALDGYILDNQVSTVQQTPLGPIYTSKVGDRNATFLKESNPPHWHVVFE